MAQLVSQRHKKQNAEAIPRSGVQRHCAALRQFVEMPRIFSALANVSIDS
jgi:hypothetical protein